MGLLVIVVIVMYGLVSFVLPTILDWWKNQETEVFSRECVLEMMPV